MKKLIVICVCALLAASASAGITPNIFNIAFDENGNGTINGNPLLYGGGNPDPLYYEIPLEVVEGDVVILEPPVDGQSTSDVLRFLNVLDDDILYHRVYVYSDIPEQGEVPELADIGIPANLLTNMITRPEQGTEDGWNGLVYIPQQGEPGYMDGATVTYNFTSDVPEPATIALLTIGGLALLRRKTA